MQLLSHRDAGAGCLSLPQCHPLLVQSWIKPSTTPSLHVHLLLSPPPVNTKVTVQQFGQAHPPSSYGSPHSTILTFCLPKSAAPPPPPLEKSQLSHNHQRCRARNPAWGRRPSPGPWPALAGAEPTPRQPPGVPPALTAGRKLEGDADMCQQ